GNEVRSAQLLQALQARLGNNQGSSAWQDFRSKNDPEAPTTVLGTSFPYETTSAFATNGLALPDVVSVQFTSPSSGSSSGSGLPTPAASANSFGAKLLRGVGAQPH